MTGMYLMHHAFRRDLRRFESAVRRTPVGDRTTWRAMGARWKRFSEVLHHHHEIEDASIWPVLLGHAGRLCDAEGQRTLHDMSAEHDQIDPCLAACALGFAAMVSHPCGDHRNALDVHVTATHSALAAHLRHEETAALPLLQRVMTPEEFAASEEAARRGYPHRLVPFLVPWALSEVPGEIARPFTREAGWIYSALLGAVRGPFQRREYAAFRYADC
jgi:hemerythrin-like domain-containing protein